MALTADTLDIQSFSPRWPTIGSLPMEQIRYAYDRPSDTLFVDFYGEARSAASVPLDLGDRDYFFVRVDVESQEVVGLQIESFLTYAIRLHPELLNALRFATLEGIGQDELSKLVPPTGRDLVAPRDPRSFLEDVARWAA